MVKFGLPDISVNQVSPAHSDAMSTVISGAMQNMFERPTLATLGELALELPAQTSDVQIPGTGRALLKLEVVKPQEGDAENRLCELIFPGPSAKLQERHASLLVTVLGTSEKIVWVKGNDPKLQAASAAARARLLAMKPHFVNGPHETERLQVKGRFKTDQGGAEYMWISVISWKGSQVEGVLDSAAKQVPDLHAGARVSVEENTIFDYIYTKSDGSVEGNETSKLLEAR
jgi:uncharacterized protein YegJ (DUF2314 family)